MPLFSAWWYRPDSAAMPTPLWETVFIWAVSRSKHFFPSKDKDKPQNLGSGVMGEQVKAFAKSWDLSLTSEFHMVEEENRLMEVDFWPPHILFVLTLLHPTQGWGGGSHVIAIHIKINKFITGLGRLQLLHYSWGVRHRKQNGRLQLVVPIYLVILLATTH